MNNNKQTERAELPKTIWRIAPAFIQNAQGDALGFQPGPSCFVTVSLVGKHRSLISDHRIIRHRRVVHVTRRGDDTAHDVEVGIDCGAGLVAMRGRAALHFRR